jgi:hypothetical protein
MRFEYAPGATPIDLDEAKGLIPAHLTLQRELNEYEEANILAGNEWLFARRRGDPLNERGRLPAEIGALVIKALDAAVNDLPVRDVSAETSAQQSAGGVVEQAHVDVETLRHGGAGRCELEDGPSLAVETVRRLACDASIVRALAL